MYSIKGQQTDLQGNIIDKTLTSDSKRVAIEVAKDFSRRWLGPWVITGKYLTPITYVNGKKK